MKSKLFTHKFFVVLCISVVALLGLSFHARATIVITDLNKWLLMKNIV